MKFMTSGPIISWQIDVKQWKQYQTLFWGASKWMQMVTVARKLKDPSPWKKSSDESRHRMKKQRHYIADKGLSSQSYGFSSSHVRMWELDSKESWALKKWCFWTRVLEKTHDSLLEFKERKPVHSKGNQSWIFLGRTDAGAEAPILWPPDAKKNWLTGKDPNAGKVWL